LGVYYEGKIGMSNVFVKTDRGVYINIDSVREIIPSDCGITMLVETGAGASWEKTAISDFNIFADTLQASGVILVDENTQQKGYCYVYDNGLKRK
jgi:hypothetical protein